MENSSLRRRRDGGGQTGGLKMRAFLVGFFMLLAASEGATQRVRLHLVAVDHRGAPVENLRAEELQVIVEGQPRAFTGFERNESKRILPQVIFWDLQDFTVPFRAEMEMRIRDAFKQVTVDTPTYLYLLSPSGQVVPVVPISEHRQTAGEIQNFGDELDTALRANMPVRRINMNEYPTELLQKRYDTLFQLGQTMQVLRGRKQLLWITYGLPSTTRVTGDFQDLSPILRDLAARFNGADIAIYSLFPAIAANANYAADGLSIISAATGGRRFRSKDVAMVVRKARADGISGYELEFDAEPGTGKQELRGVKVVCARKEVRLQCEGAYLTQ